LINLLFINFIHKLDL